MQWLIQSLILNAEAEKDHPSPLVAASAGFTVNLSVVFLKLVEPIINDVEKLKKVDWKFLLSKDPVSGGKIFLKDSTKLAPSSVLNTDTDGSSSLSASEEETSTSDFTFITQSFFMCWRALHLGIVQQYNKYQGILRGLSHYSAGLETNDQNSITYLILKLINDVLLLGSNQLR